MPAKAAGVSAMAKTTAIDTPNTFLVCIGTNLKNTAFKLFLL